MSRNDTPLWWVPVMSIFREVIIAQKLDMRLFEMMRSTTADMVRIELIRRDLTTQEAGELLVVFWEKMLKAAIRPDSKQGIRAVFEELAATIEGSE